MTHAGSGSPGGPQPPTRHPAARTSKDWLRRWPMGPQCVLAPARSPGLALTERVAALRQAQSPPPLGETDRDRAARRLHDWRSQPPFATGSYFAQRLAADGI